MDKINVYVPDNIGIMLENDAVMFEVYKRDRKTINKNRFLGMLVTGYYDDYVTEMRSAYEKILTAIETEKLSVYEKEQIADKILRETVLPTVPSRKGKNPKRFSLKPTKNTEILLEQILLELGDNDYISQYFCRMFMGYCDKPFSKREQIIFKSNYEMLMAACTTQKSLTLKTIWNTNDIHEVIPYKVVTGTEEMFNYLLCAEINRNTGKQEARAYRLNRIDRLNYGRSMKVIDDTVRRYLDMMIKYGPQYMINEEEETCVRLDPYGIKSFNKIYYGRPQYDRIEKKDDQTYLYFRCSLDQLFLYFKRFENGSAEVLHPESLRNRMIKFHEDAIEVYKGR